jgi:TP901 family phage tail tape measure protein
MKHVAELIVSLRDRVTKPARAASKSIERLHEISRRNTRHMNQMRGQMLDAAAGAYALARAFADPVKSAMEFESAMADVRKVVDFDTPDGFKNLSNEILEMSKNLPMTASSIAAIVAAAGQAGMQGSELTEFAEMAAQVGIAFDMSADQTGDALAKIKTALQLTVEETGSLADAMNHLSNNMASDAPSLIEFMNRVGAQGEQFGFTAEQTVAIGSAMVAAGSEANVAATSFRNVGKALTKGAAATAAQKQAYKALGLDAKKVAKQMQVDAVTTLEAVLTKVRAMPRHMQAATLSQLFGDEARALAPLVENMDLLRGAINSVAKETEYAGSVGDEYAVRVDTAANKLQLFRNKVEATSIAIGQALIPALNATLDVLGPVIDQVTAFATANPELVRTLALVAGGLVALRVAMIAGRFATLFMKGAILDLAIGATRGALGLLSLLNPIKLVRAGMMALRLAVVSTGIGAILVGIAMAGVWIYNNWSGLTAFFQEFGAAFQSALGPALPIMQPIIDGVKFLANAIGSLTGKVDASDEVWGSWGATMGGAVAGAISGTVEKVQAIGQWFKDAWQSAVDLKDAIASFVIEFKPPTVPKILDWLLEVSVKGIQAACDILWPVLPDWLRALFSFAQTGISFALNIDWPEPPGWVKWAMEQAGSGWNKAGSAIGGGAAAVKEGAGSFFNGVGDAWNRTFSGDGVDAARAAGGSVVAGKTYLVGERGQELFHPKQDGYISNAADTHKLLNAGGPSGPVSVSFGDIHIHDASDPQRVINELTSRLRDELSGVFADTNWSSV